MKILLGNLNAKIGREDIYKPTIGMRVYMKLVMMMEFDTSKNLTVRTTMFPLCNINLLQHLLMGKCTTKLTIF
jgi:hypothetical protein